MPMALNSGVPMIAPRMPVRITSPAVSDGSPPMLSAIPIAMGEVTDFGASELTVSMLAPSAAAMATAETTAVTAPAIRAAKIGNSVFRTSCRCW